MWPLVIVYPLAVLALFPNEPLSSFGSRVNVPKIAFTFRQSECENGVFTEDIAGKANLISQGLCPFKNTTIGSFSTSSSGAWLNDATNPYILKTPGPMDDLFHSWTEPDPESLFKSVSIEMWITPRAAIFESDQSHNLLEIGPDSLNVYPSLKMYLQNYDREPQLVMVFDYTGTDSLGVPYPGNSNKFNRFVFPTKNPESTFAKFGNRRYLGVPFYLALSYKGNESYPSEPVEISIGIKGGPIETYSFSTYSERYIQKFNFKPSDIFRIGSYQVQGPDYGERNFPGEINFLAFHDKALSRSEVHALFSKGTMNSNPVLVRDFWFEFTQGRPSFLINLNLIPNYDAENNPVVSFTITSLPSRGFLTYDGVRIVAPGFVVLNSQKLSFNPGDPYVFSENEGQNTCRSEFARFSIVASDGICDDSRTFKNAPNCLSPFSTTAKICIRDVPDLPFSESRPVVDVRVGSFYIFELVPIDRDDVFDVVGNLSLYRMRNSIAPNDYQPNARVYFNQTIGTFGRIVNAINDTHCGKVLIPANVGLKPQSIQGVSSFKFCYTVQNSFFALPLNKESLGMERFGFQFQDNVKSPKGPTTVLSVAVKSALEPCPVSQYQASHLPGDSVCMTHGKETTSSSVTPNVIPIYLQGKDSWGRGRDFFLEIASLPAHGLLFFTNSSNYTNPVKIGSRINPIENSKPNLFYVGETDFFTRLPFQRMAGGTFQSLNGTGFHGCTNLDYPGCPDAFTYRLVTHQPVLEKSELGTYLVMVDAIVSPVSITAPLSILASTVELTPIPTFLLDVDDDAFLVGVKVSLVAGFYGGLALVLPPNFLFPQDFVIEGCEIDLLSTGSCQQLHFFSRPSKVNQAFQHLFFASNDFLKNDTQRVTISIFKPEFGYPNEKYAFVEEKAASTQVRIFTLPTLKTVPVDGLGIAIIVGAVAVVLLLLICFCYIFSRICLCLGRGTSFRRKISSGMSGKRSSRSEFSSQSGRNFSSLMWEKRIPQNGGEVYFCNLETGVHQAQPPEVQFKTRNGK